MTDNNDTQNSSIQAVRKDIESIRLQEGYQPLERKGHQPTTRPTRPSPPQSVSADIPFTPASTSDNSTTPPASPAAPTPPQTDAQK